MSDQWYIRLQMHDTNFGFVSRIVGMIIYDVGHALVILI
jgi:hypothetical protein